MDSDSTVVHLSFITVIALFVLLLYHTISLPKMSPENSPLFCLTGASLTQFNLTNTLDYNFKVNISVKNPTNKIVAYYDIAAVAWYKDNNFTTVSLAPFQQGYEETTFVGATVVFQGQSFINLKPKQLAEYYNETLAGAYNDLAVDLVLRISSFEFWGQITMQFRRLSVPLIDHGKSAPPFNSVCRKIYYGS